ncbi:MAG: hypothetical protein PUF46_00185 [Oscillospiraceae bacterium]|nr:hypothetical protein [Oscillospiraceae bacterium]MDY4104109.1 hypothetical protein [Oscillospiraceae bacterium]
MKIRSCPSPAAMPRQNSPAQAMPQNSRSAAVWRPPAHRRQARKRSYTSPRPAPAARLTAI